MSMHVFIICGHVSCHRNYTVYERKQVKAGARTRTAQRRVAGDTLDADFREIRESNMVALTVLACK